MIDRKSYVDTLDLINNHSINTVCMHANCPNRYECFSNKTATFLILGSVCTRDCKYCNILHGTPDSLDDSEIERIIDAVKKMNIDYAVITSVTRDDLPDGGTAHYVKIIHALKKIGCHVEVLIPDNLIIEDIVAAAPDVINHNIETVRRLFINNRPGGDYQKSIDLLKSINRLNPDQITKSGFMVGLGETDDEINELISELNLSGVSFITIGQYLQPTKNHAPVLKYYSDEEFAKLKSKNIIAGKFVRSSYNAKDAFNNR